MRFPQPHYAAGVMPEEASDVFGWSRQRQRSQSIFLTAFIVRILVVGTLLMSASLMLEVSRDSVKYDMAGHEIADLYRTGQNNWSLWVDDGWFQFIGLVYHHVGPHLILIQLLNVVLASATAVLIFRTALLATGRLDVALVCGYTFSLFPSVVYYTSLPLKEAPAVFALVAVCYGTLQYTLHARATAWRWIAVGLLILAALRVYLVAVIGGCFLICVLARRLKGGVAGMVQLALILCVLGLAAVWAVQGAGMEITEYRFFRYFDLDYINHIRSDMTSGNAKMFEYKTSAAYGEGWISNVAKFGKGVFYFIFSIDIMNVTRGRQLAALPEMLFFLYCLPSLFAGVVTGWRTRPRHVLPLILLSAVLVLVYGGTATNMGAMYRWRLQALPFLIILIVYGAAVRRKGIIYGLVCRFSGQGRNRYSHHATAQRSG